MTEPMTTTRDPADSGELIKCPLCHAARTGADDTDVAGWWRCARCGQSWDHARLAVVRSYAISQRDRDARVAATMRAGPQLVSRRA